MASEHDFLLKRTIGVITKCDITQDKNQVSLDIAGIYELFG